MRNTPAGAGKTPFSRRSSPSYWKHPRRRGEDQVEYLIRINQLETPPQARGRLYRASDGASLHGNTPAGAGKTAVHGLRSAFAWKHPRRRGEDTAGSFAASRYWETPPQARGRRRLLDLRPLLAGNTPAGAGKTKGLAHRGSSDQKHPRRRGEDASLTQVLHLNSETPPQARGRRQDPQRSARLGGNTPAGAGKTARGGFSRARARKHPRRRGEDFRGTMYRSLHEETPPQARGRPQYLGVKVQDLRNTPAGAGKTLGRHRRLAGRRKHPRRRGEDSALGPSSAPMREIPPQARGRPSNEHADGHGPGNTPAGAVSKTSRFEIDFDRWNVIAGASAANEVCDPGNSAS